MSKQKWVPGTYTSADVRGTLHISASSRVKVDTTVTETVKAMGKGWITTEEITTAINNQIAQYPYLTEVTHKQVAASLNSWANLQGSALEKLTKDRFMFNG